MKRRVVVLGAGVGRAACRGNVPPSQGRVRTPGSLPFHACAPRMGPVPRPEPLFYEPGREPGFYSSVPNHRCFQGKQVAGHSPLEMQMIHRVLIDFPADQPCKDCHNHDMRNGQRFYEKILPAKGADLLQVSGAAFPGR